MATDLRTSPALCNVWFTVNGRSYCDARHQMTAGDVLIKAGYMPGNFTLEERGVRFHPSQPVMVNGREFRAVLA